MAESPFEMPREELYRIGDPAENQRRGKRFRSLLQKAWAAPLASWGFVGKGSLFRRRQGSVLEVVQTQAWKYGGGLCVNLGVHFDFLARRPGSPTRLDDFEEFHCVLRRRLAPAPRVGDFWWRYGCDASESQACVNHLVATLGQDGMAFFERVGGLPGGYADLTEEQAKEFLGGLLFPAQGQVWSLVQEIRAHLEEKK